MQSQDLNSAGIPNEQKEDQSMSNQIEIKEELIEQSSARAMRVRKPKV